MPPGTRVVGVVPAAGRGTRVGLLPCSKEIYPVGTRIDVVSGRPERRPKVAAHYLLDQMRRSGAQTAYMIIGQGKWDIPAYLDDGALADIALAYLTMRRSPSTADSIDRAFPFVHDALVLLGFPDILIEPADAFSRLLERQRASGADAVLGLFEAQEPHRVDLVQLAADGRVRRIVIKPRRTRLRQCWLIAVWTPRFTGFLHAHLAEGAGGPREDELFVGHVIQAAIDAGFVVDTVCFAGASYHDIGTPGDLLRAQDLLARREEAR